MQYFVPAAQIEQECDIMPQGIAYALEHEIWTKIEWQANF